MTAHRRMPAMGARVACGPMAGHWLSPAHHDVELRSRNQADGQEKSPIRVTYRVQEFTFGRSCTKGQSALAAGKFSADGTVGREYPVADRAWRAGRVCRCVPP